MNRKLLISTLHNRYKNLYFFWYGSLFDWQFRPKKNKTNQLNFSGKLTLYQGNLFNWGNFLRQAISVSGEIFPVEYSHQTCSLGNLILWVFPQRTCQRIRVFCSAWKVFTDKRYHPSKQNFFYLQSVFKTKENDWQLLRYFLLWLVWPSLVVLLISGIFSIWKNLFRNTCCKLFAIISFALLQSRCFIFYVVSDHSVKHLLLKCLL